MKFVANEMPSQPSACPYSEWKPNPPFIEEPGYFVCTISSKDKRSNLSCTLDEKEHVCRFLVQIPPQDLWLCRYATRQYASGQAYQQKDKENGPYGIKLK